MFDNELSLEELKELKLQAESAINNYGKKNVLRAKRSPDEYRGDFSCVEILDEVDLDWQYFDENNKALVIKNGEPAAVLRQYYGSGGTGKLSAEEIEPLPGFNIEWV